MLDIYYQLAGIVLTIMIALLFASKTRLLFDTDKAFSYLLLNILTATALDIISVYTMELYANDMLPNGIAQLFDRIYMVSLVSVGYFLFRYIFVAIYRSESNPIIKYGAAVPLVLCLVKALFTNISCKVLLLYLLFNAGIIFWQRKKIEKQYFISSTVFIAIIFASIIIRLFNPQYRILTFTMSLALLFMYLEMENPDDYVDYVSGALNDYAFYKWGEKLFENKAETGLFILSICEADYTKKKMGISEYEEMLGEWKQQLARQHNRGKIFRLDSGEFICLVKSLDQELKIYEEIKILTEGVFAGYTGVSAEQVRYGMIPSMTRYFDMLAFSQDLRFFLKHLQTLSGNELHILDEAVLSAKNEEDFIVLSLKNAIIEDKIMVYYQPIYSTAKRRYTTAEALIRIQDLNGQFMSPERFIPIAEQRGYILTLGHAVFDNVCRFIREQDLEGKGFDYIEINISTVQCMQEGLASELVSIMKEYSISPGFINLEITETAAIKSENTLMQNMQRLIQLGVSFSLDDYGSGYSNLDYVIRMPFHLVKLDKLLVWSSFEQAKTGVLLKTSVEMFKRMHLKIVAEGVETKEQALYLDEIGVDYLQGFLFSKPVSEETFIEIINDNKRRNVY